MKLKNEAISNLTRLYINGNIYFWGAGKAFDKYVQKFLQYNDIEECIAIVDKIQIGEKWIGDYHIPIIRPDEFVREVTDKDVLVITTKYYDEVLAWLRKYDTQNKVRVCIYSFTVNEQLDKERNTVSIPNRITTTEKQLIPKTIHYCWFGNNPIPEQYKTWMESWKKYCPDYEIIEWNEANYDIHKNTFIEQAYNEKKWAFVSDYARLDVIYNYGGVYLDTDVELIRSIDDLLYNHSFCGFEQKEYVNFGLGFGSEPHNDIIREIMQVYESKSVIDSEGKMDMTPCPRIQTEVLERHGLQRNGEYQVIDGIVVFPEIVLCPLSPYTFKLTDDLSNSYMIHHFAASWNPEYAESRKNRERFNALFT